MLTHVGDISDPTTDPPPSPCSTQSSLTRTGLEIPFDRDARRARRPKVAQIEVRTPDDLAADSVMIAWISIGLITMRDPTIRSDLEPEDRPKLGEELSDEAIDGESSRKIGRDKCNEVT